MKAIIAILSAALVALGGVVIHLWRQLDVSRQAVVQHENDILMAPANQAAVIGSTVPPLDVASELGGVSKGVEQDKALKEDKPLDEQIRALITTGETDVSAEKTARVKTVLVASMYNEYPDVGKVLDLSRDEVDRLFDLLYKQSFGSIEARGSSAEDELEELLGSKYEKWQEYKTELPTRRQVRDLAAVLDSAGSPLSDSQRNSLIPALVDAERRNSQARVVATETGSLDEVISRLSRFTPEANRYRLDTAAAHLTPQQLESYQQVLDRATIQETKLRNLTIQARKDAEAPRRSQP